MPSNKSLDHSFNSSRCENMVSKTFGRKMIKITVTIVCCMACLSCAKKPDVTKLDNGYFFQREQIAKDTIQWTLRRETPQQSGVVAQAIVTGEEVISVLPTPVHYHSCIPTAHAGSDFFIIPQAGELLAPFHLHRNGTFSFKGRTMDRARFALLVQKLATFSTNLSIVLQVETPCALSDLTNAIARCTSAAGGGFGVTYKGSSRELEIEELKEPIEGDVPDIPVVFTNETAEPETGHVRK
jgi:hypothetical protein